MEQDVAEIIENLQGRPSWSITIIITTMSSIVVGLSVALIAGWYKMRNNIVEQLKLHEGFRKYPYEDTEGYLTIGYGHNLDANGLPKDICEELLKRKIDETKTKLEKYSWFNKLNDVRKKVLVDMGVNMGIGGLMTFKKMIKAIKKDNFEKAADEMLDSRWSNQVGSRANRLAKMMRTGADYDLWQIKSRS